MGERKLKLVLDTNVLISAVGWSVPPEECLDLSMDGFMIKNIPYCNDISTDLPPLPSSKNGTKLSQGSTT